MHGALSGTHRIPAQVLRELHQLQQAVAPDLRRRPLVLHEVVIHRHLVRCGVHLRLHGRVLHMLLLLLLLLLLRLLLRLLPLRLPLGLPLGLSLRLSLRLPLGLRLRLRLLLLLLLLLLRLLLPLLLVLRRGRRPGRLRRRPLPARVRGCPDLHLRLRRLRRLLARVLWLSALGLGPLLLVLALARGLGLHRRGGDLRLLVLEVLELLRRHLHRLARRVAGHHVLVLRLRLLVLLHRHALRHECLRDTDVSMSHPGV